jgi:hypothetical protein
MPFGTSTVKLHLSEANHHPVLQPEMKCVEDMGYQLGEILSTITWISTVSKNNEHKVS